MYRLANGSQVASLPTPAADVGTPGYATDGMPGGQLGSIVDADQFNIHQEELIAIVLAGGGTLSKSNNAQVLAALQAIFAAKAATLAVGAVWNDLHASRAIGIIYTNSTGKDIAVAVNLNSNASYNPYFWVGGVVVGAGVTVASGVASPIMFIVPAGATYKVTVSAGTGSLTSGSWMELY